MNKNLFIDFTPSHMYLWFQVSTVLVFMDKFDPNTPNQDIVCWLI